MIPMLLLVGCSSLSSAKNTVSSLATQQLMVEAFLMDGEKLMASPRIITMNGEKAQTDMRTVAAPVPGQARESLVVYNWWYNLNFKKGVLFSTEDSY